MPRSNGVYSEPAGSKGTPNTTIQSAPYNALVDDLVADANTARPVTAGGTGATNATAARTALGADNASNLTQGTVADARLPTTMAGKNFSSNTSVALGGNIVTLTTDGNIEITRAGGSGYIDIKDSGAEDFDVRLQQVGTTKALEITAAAGVTVNGQPVLTAASSVNAATLGGQLPSYYTDILSRLGYTPVHQGGGSGQLGNTLYIGWDGTSLRFQVDANSYGNTWPININGLAADSSKLNGQAGSYYADIVGRLGYTPVQQGGGANQLGNKVYIGWRGDGTLGLQIDSADKGNSWPINIFGNSATATSATSATSAANAAALGGIAAANYPQFSYSALQNEINFPIGQVLQVVIPSQPVRNASASIYLSAGNTAAYTTNSADSAGTVTGTWRSRGVATGGGTALFQRVG